MPPQAAVTVSSGAAPRAAVLLPLPLPAPYDYALAPGVVPKRGLLVKAPLGGRELLGVVWGKAEGGIAEEKLRTAEPLDFRLPVALCDFLDWVARYTLSPVGAVLAQALRVRGVFDAEVPPPRAAFGKRSAAAHDAGARARLEADGGRACARACFNRRRGWRHAKRGAGTCRCGRADFREPARVRALP